jgi:hypothetical protein
MATDYPSIKGSGPAYDLEAEYLQYGFKLLPDPPGLIPFGKQGQPIPDPLQRHTNYAQVYPATHPNAVNMQPFGHFVGTSLAQINQPAFLGVNEQFR